MTDSDQERHERNERRRIERLHRWVHEPDGFAREERFAIADGDPIRLFAVRQKRQAIIDGRYEDVEA